MISDRLPEVEPLLGRIARAQEGAARGFRPSPAADASSPNGGPLLSPDRVEVDARAFARLLGDVLAILRDWGGEEPPPEVDAGAAPALDEAGVGALLEACIGGGDPLLRFAERFGQDVDTFLLAARCAFAPFLRPQAEGLRGAIEGLADLPGRCPVCGAEPVMAAFDKEDGHRRLACGLCGTEWRFARLKCPFCGTEDQKSLGFLEVEGLEGLRADVCEACGRYLKAVDRRKVGDAVGLEAADAVTPELDEAAISFLEERRRGARAV